MLWIRRASLTASSESPDGCRINAGLKIVEEVPHVTETKVGIYYPQARESPAGGIATLRPFRRGQDVAQVVDQLWRGSVAEFLAALAITLAAAVNSPLTW
jgi:hypothetical protein